MELTYNAAKFRLEEAPRKMSALKVVAVAMLVGAWFVALGIGETERIHVMQQTSAEATMQYMGVQQ